MSSTTGLVAGLATELLRLRRDRLDSGCGIPRRSANLDAGYLGGLLRRHVDAVETIDATTGTTDRVRLRLKADGLPESVFVKMPSASTPVRLFTNLMDLDANEARFYRDIRPRLEIEAPEVLGVDHDPATKRCVLVLEDLAARGCTFGDVRHPLDLATAGSVLDGLARLHAMFWQSPRLDTELAWIRANAADPMIPLVARAVRWFGRRQARTDLASVPVGGAAILAAYSAVARELDTGAHTVLHGDPHPGNCYFSQDAAGLLDWQVVRRGYALRDVAYHIVLSLDTETRRAGERDLLDRYRDALAAAGGPVLDTGRAWDCYRKRAAYPYVAATFTAGLAGLQEQEVVSAGLSRAAAAIDDLGTAATLDSLR